jgi:DNA-binding transcriptional regulator YiaG
MWHIDCVSNTRISQKVAQRFSFPPYYVAAVDGKLPILGLPGDTYEMLERSLAPSAEEVRGILLRLRSELNWPRSALAAFLGVSRDVVRRWETGERNASGAARRLIWLLNLLVRHPEKLTNGLDLIVWGKADELREFSRKLAGAP